MGSEVGGEVKPSCFMESSASSVALVIGKVRLDFLLALVDRMVRTITALTWLINDRRNVRG